MRIVEMKNLTWDGSGTEVLDLCDNKSGTSVVGEVYIELPEAVSITVKGYVDENAQTIKVVKMNDYTIADSISAAGVYMIPTGAYKKLDFEYSNADNSEVVIKTIF